MKSAFAGPGSYSPSLRVRLLLAGLLVQTVMLALLIVNGIKVMDEKLAERTRAHLDEQKQFLKAVLAPPVAIGDYASAQKVLERVRREDGIAYLVLQDTAGRIVAASGWEHERALPPLKQVAFSEPGVLDTAVPIEMDGRNHGILRFGVSTRFMERARSDLIKDNLAIGVVALILSTLTMVGLSYWLTRSLVRLTRASAQVAAGDLDVRLPVESQDEVGRLTRAFNTMAG
ncbi:MAG TPA: HAMP domain-containing protein, partial [Burkholderiales bacterium]|nr:HAMP domain-containing protein [Burkholderiales bacterium]